MSWRKGVIAVAVVAGLIAPGCGGQAETSNRSTLSTADPEKARVAEAQVAAAAAAAREAEAKALPPGMKTPEDP